MQSRTMTSSGMRWSILTNWPCCLAKPANNSSQTLWTRFASLVPASMPGNVACQIRR